MTAVMIGVDPHKGSHTAVVISPAEEPLGEIRVRASAAQAGKLAEWAAAWPERTWAVEGAAGVGRLLDWQLVAAGERVLDVQPKLASRVRLLQAGDTNKNDPDDALSVAVAALRSRTCRQVTAEDHPAVLKVRAERHRDLARLRNQVACRLHAVLCDLVPGGLSKEISAAQAARMTSQFAIARDLRMLGRIYEAHEILVSVSSILIQKRSLSRQFQLVVGADLIVSLRRCGKYPEALAQAESISASTKPHSGANHRETLRTGTNIISDLRIAGRLQDARILGRTHRSGLSVDRRRGPSTKLGVDHPETQMITQYERMTRDIELMMD